MYPESSKDLNIETEKEVYFFTVPFEPLNNFSAHMVKIWGKDFQTAEHAFQWKKFSEADSVIAEQIFTAISPYAVKQISDAHKANQPVNWKDLKVSIMEEILKAKYDQHEDVRMVLQRTGNRVIVENSPVDNFWGLGPEKQGENMIGKIWMKIRGQNI